jgi:Fic family protein
LTNLLLLQAGYVYVPYVSHEKLIEDNKPDYYLALRASQKTFHGTTESVVVWMTFFLKIVLLQSQAAVASCSRVAVRRALREDAFAKAAGSLALSSICARGNTA